MPRGPDYQKERGERQMNRVLELLAGGPMTSYELADAMHLSRQAVLVAVRRLRARPHRRVYLHDFHMIVGRPRYVFALGNKRDMTIERYQSNKIISCMEDELMPWSLYDLASRLPMEYGTVKIYMRYLVKEQKVHVAGWNWSDRPPYPLYLIGKGNDVPRPKSKPLPVSKSRRPASIFAALGIAP